MSIELLIDFSEFWSRLSADVRSAQESVFVQTFAFEGDAVGKQLSAALLSSGAPDRRILADSFTSGERFTNLGGGGVIKGRYDAVRRNPRSGRELYHPP